MTALNRSQLRAVAVLALLNALLSTSTFAVLPELPVYLERRGASPALVGLVIAAAFVGALLVQYPAGRLVDRLGHRFVLLGAASAYALATAGYLVVAAPYADLAWRAIQGAATAATLVASLSYVAATLPERVRGRGFSAVTAAGVSGIALGPLLGGAFGVGRFSALWTVTTGLSVASLVLIVLANLPVSPRQHQYGHNAPARTVLGTRPGRAVLVVAGAGGILVGVYESCWTLLLVARHAGPGAITLSWSLFAIPYLLVAPLGGWLVDRTDRRRLMLAAVLSGSIFAFTYAVVRPVPWLLALGVLEGVATALVGPAVEAVLSRLAVPAMLGRELGALASAQTATQAIGALGGGALFAIGLPLPFVVGGVIGLLAVWQVSALLPVSAGLAST